MTRTMLIALLLGALCLSGCSRSGISGAGSMRVEISVYEGPVGQSPAVNIGQISALLDDTIRAVEDKYELAAILYGEYCAPPRGNTGAAQNTNRLVRRTTRDCHVLAEVLSSATLIGGKLCDSEVDPDNPRRTPGVEIIPNLDALENGQPGHSFAWRTRDLCERNPGLFTNPDPTKRRYWRDPLRISQISEQMRLTAVRLTDSYVGYVPREKEVRHIVQEFAFFLDNRASELKNRSYILEKQIAECIENRTTDKWKVPVEFRTREEQRIRERLKREGQPVTETSSLPEDQRLRAYLAQECRDNGQLALTSDESSRQYPTGDYLRGSRPSRFIEAFGWFNANLSARGTGAYLKRNRVRAIRALTEDRHWETVNEVYHSGQGDVSAAFIKDELGNWSLKSFSNEPGELLNAYSQAFSATLKATTGFIRGSIASPDTIGQATGLLDVADRLATGRISASASIGVLGLDSFRRRTVERLTAAKTRFATAATKLDTEIKNLDGQAMGIQTAWNTARAKALQDENIWRQSLSNANACTASNGEGAAQCEDVIKLAQLNERNAQTSASSANTKQDELIEAKAKLEAKRNELKALGDAAASEANRILADYQFDLDAMRDTVIAQNSKDDASQ